jgi:hypothetical protein
MQERYVKKSLKDRGFVDSLTINDNQLQHADGKILISVFHPADN